MSLPSVEALTPHQISVFEVSPFINNQLKIFIVDWFFYKPITLLNKI